MQKELLELRGIEKSFPGVKALSNASMKLYAGEVVGLCGENGAGKSTLIKIISGLYQADAGEIYVEGKNVDIPDTQTAMDLGISVIYQELSLVNEMNIAENLFLGHLPVSQGRIDYKKLYADAEKVMKTLGMDFDVKEARIGDLNISNQQLIEIGKAIARNAKILIMDEPTSSLDDDATQRLFGLIDQFRRDGYGIIYISHHMDELFRIADRIIVLRDGKIIDDRKTEDWDVDQLVFAMVNRTLGDTYPKRKNVPGEVILSLEDVSSEGVRHVNMQLRKGEILGIAGIVGAGRSELLKTIYGVFPVRSGVMKLHGKEVKIRNPWEALEHNVAMLFEDRRHEGLILDASVKENIMLPHYARISKKGLVELKKKREIAEEGMKEYAIKSPSIEHPVGKLSGGNQQKVLFKRITYGDPDIYLLDEPTRGIDVSVKKEMYQKIVDLAEAGNAVMLVTSELPEILGLADRVLVMRHHTIVGEVTGSDITQENIMRYATGGKKDE